MQQAYTEGHYLERLTPILGLCHGVFIERFIFRLSFRGKQATRARLGNTIHETRRKKQRPYAGTSSYQNYANSTFLLLYSNIPILHFLIYPTILCKFSHLRKNSRESGSSFYFLSCLHLKNLHPHSPQRSVKEIFRRRIEQKRCNKMKRVFLGR